MCTHPDNCNCDEYKTRTNWAALEAAWPQRGFSWTCYGKAHGNSPQAQTFSRLTSTQLIKDGILIGWEVKCERAICKESHVILRDGLRLISIEEYQQM